MSSTSNASASASGGIGFAGLLTVALVVLKILGYGTYSWFVAFLPIIISFSIGLLFLIIVGIILLVASLKG